jgi:hypothetical protein
MPRRKLLALLTLAFAGQDGLRKGAVFKTQNVAPIHTARLFWVYSQRMDDDNLKILVV